MSKEQIEIKPSLWFYLKNLFTLLKIKRINPKRIERFVELNQKLSNPIIPRFEGTGGPMEEGMIYLMFDSKKREFFTIDSVYRIFWVNSPSLGFTMFDGFLISTNLESNHWLKHYNYTIFTNLNKYKFHQELETEDYKLLFDGTWNMGYKMSFNDKLLGITGNLSYKASDPKGVLTYYNGRTTYTPSMSQKFYDMFSIQASGDLEVLNNKYDLLGGRGIIEHGLGLFSNYHIHEWRWLNLQFAEGSLHLFYHSLDLESEWIFESGEGAAVFNRKWFHFLADEFQIVEIGFDYNSEFKTKIPVEWSVKIKQRNRKNLLIELNVKSAKQLTWTPLIGKKNQIITNYVLIVSGKWEGSEVSGAGTMEYQYFKK